ncbi:Cell division coordinator CpoB [Sinobacterium norvegicum]|uniref:Cell division coordinator CpoB n=1 Tax=Sinobacterium norvegicum TaxID=1641715 RepID=A0ABM9AH41_9GAMM|nr:tetratricopeptide repeat protein [Sinobacterium norvegicum]CAH0992518.1 Cell division coordinator CpoB [Sinobacterium norvegicum]
MNIDSKQVMMRSRVAVGGVPLRRFIGAVAVLLLSACAGQSQKIGSLNYQVKEEQPIAFDQLDHQQVREEYQELLDLFKDDELKEQIERRIADVYMLEGQHQQVATPVSSKSYYKEAILSYREVLKKYPNSPDNADVLYQLAKAYDMDGEAYKARDTLLELTTKHPQYSYNTEAYFRLGDIYFNDKKYRDAERFYQRSLAADTTALGANAYYMLAWSQYKQGAYQESLTSFYAVISALLDNGITVDQLPAADKPLLDDTIHSMSLALAQQGGTDSINDIQDLAKQPYVWMIYQDLANYYLEKERYEDSAATLRNYVGRYRDNDKSPELHRQLIASYVAGGFPQQARQEKASYIDYYYDNQTIGNRVDIEKNIQQYIQQLASFYHGSGQHLMVEATNLEPSNKKYKKIHSQALADFSTAASYYQRYIDYYPQGKRVAEYTFLTAETYFSAQQYAQAIAAYEQVAYVMGNTGNYAADAGYAAIVAYQQQIDGLNEGSRKAKNTQAKAADSMLKFAASFPLDKRSGAVLTNAAEYLFGIEQYQQAINVTAGLINKGDAIDGELRKTAYGITAHSYFKLNNFALASNYYLEQRSMVAVNSEEYERISERVATAVYQQAQQLKVEQQKPESTVANDQIIALLLSIKELAPATAVRAVAQYDAATLLLAEQQWQQSIDLLTDLSMNFSQHKLAKEFPRKLAFAYEKSGDPSQAANMYLSLSKKDGDAEVRREALFIAAKLYKELKDYDTSIILFKRYAHAYEKPFDTRMEARYQLAQNYQLQGDKIRHLYWLRRVIDGDAKGGSARTARSQWLAAWACVEYGDYFAWEFSQRRLYQPLEKSLPRKNESLQAATSRYQQAAEYGILEFTTQSSYKLATLYATFASDLRKAPAPKGLSSGDRQMFAAIIEQQAAPFAGLADELLLSNIVRGWQGEFNPWIKQSFDDMALRHPIRFGKQEMEVAYGDQIR